MAGTPSIRHPRAFARAAAGGPDHDRAVGLLAAVIDEIRPDVLLTYDADGGYGHPDHVAAHQVSLAAVSTAGWRVRRVLAVVRPRTATVAAFDALAVAGPPDGYLPAEAADTGFLVDDEAVAFGVPVGGSAAAREAALAAHATQVELIPGGFALSNRIAQPLQDTEYFRLVAGQPPPAGEPATDLFAGLG